MVHATHNVVAVMSISSHMFQVDAIREKIGYPDFILNNTALETEYAGVFCYLFDLPLIYSTGLFCRTLTTSINIPNGTVL